MAIEIIPKPKVKIPPWLNFLFYFSIVLLIASPFAYFTLDYFLKKTETNLQTLEETLAEQKMPQEIALENRVFDYQKKIEDFSWLINQHLYSSKFFDFFQKICHPKIWFSQISLDLKEYQLVVSGEAETFLVLGQQLQIFKQENLIKSVNLARISMGREGGVDFSFNLLLNPIIFK